jgi:hypothetical protein
LSVRTVRPTVSRYVFWWSTVDSMIEDSGIEVKYLTFLFEPLVLLRCLYDYESNSLRAFRQ